MTSSQAPGVRVGRRDDGSGADPSPGVDRRLAGLLAADPTFDLWIIDGERPERLTELLRTGRTEGVSLARRGP